MARSEVVFLHPAQVYANAHPACVSTVCGPGVVICLWDSAHRWGGICHYVVAVQPRRVRPTPHFGPVALRTLLRELRELGSVERNLQAKVFGGALPPNGIADLSEIAAQNVAFAHEQLQKHRIAIRREDVGGVRGRKIVYYSQTNVVKVLLAEKIRERDWYAPLDILRQQPA